MGKYFEWPVVTTGDEVVGVDVDVQGSYWGFGGVGADSLSGVGLPEVDFGLCWAGEEHVSVEVEANDGDGSFMAFKDEWSHDVDYIKDYY